VPQCLMGVLQEQDCDQRGITSERQTDLHGAAG